MRRNSSHSLTSARLLEEASSCPLAWTGMPLTKGGRGREREREPACLLAAADASANRDVVHLQVKLAEWTFNSLASTPHQRTPTYFESVKSTRRDPQHQEQESGRILRHPFRRHASWPVPFGCSWLLTTQHAKLATSAMLSLQLRHVWEKAWRLYVAAESKNPGAQNDS